MSKMVHRSREGRAVYRYPPCQDMADQRQVENLDFSQAFERSQLGTALTYNNPMESKILRRKTRLLDIEKKRRENTLFHYQRTFFMKQIFDKGLNLYLSDAVPTILSEDVLELPNDDNKDGRKETEGGNMIQVQEVHESMKKENLTRSHTLSDLGSHHKGGGHHRVQKLTSSLPKYAEHPQEQCKALFIYF